MTFTRQAMKTYRESSGKQGLLEMMNQLNIFGSHDVHLWLGDILLPVKAAAEFERKKLSDSESVENCSCKHFLLPSIIQGEGGRSSAVVLTGAAKGDLTVVGEASSTERPGYKVN